MKISLRLLILALFFFNVAAYGAVTNEELGKLLLKGNYSAVTQNYNVYCSAADCRLKKAGYHSGIDYRAKTPLTVYSPVSGIVSSVGYGATNYGRVSIKIDGTNDYFMFLHLSKFSITQGRVEVGTPIGLTGDVGASGAPHLHVEVRTGKDNPSPYFPTEKDFGVNKNPASVVSSSQIQVKDFWVKSAPIVANQTNGFDAQFKLTNSSTSTQTFAKVVLAIHDANNNWIKDMKLFPNVNITAGQTWQTNLVATTSPNAGNYFVVAKVSKTGSDWTNLMSLPFTVTASNKMASVKVSCPATRLNVAQTSTCSATAYYSNGSNKPVTSTASTSWATNNSNAATVTTQGVVTAKGAASDTTVAVSASYNESGVTQQGAVNLTVVGLDGKLPADFGCTADQQTVASKAITGGTIVLMFSKKCGTNWARAISTNSTVATTVKITRTSDNKNYPVSGKGTISTPMVYSPTTKACASGKIGSVSVADNTVCR